MDRREISKQITASQIEYEKLAQRYHHLFTSENGVKILEDLENQLGANASSARRGEFDTNRVMFFEGQRSAFLYIKRLVERKKNE